MSEQVILTIIQVLGGGIFGFLIARYTNIAQRTFRKISYVTSSIQLLQLHEQTPEGIKITAEIPGNGEDSSKQMQINNAYAHEVMLKNKGNETADNLCFKIIFEESARIINHTISPSSFVDQGVSTVVPRGEENVLEIKIGYMNPQDTLKVSIIRTAEQEETEFRVIGGGKGIEVEKFKKKANFLALVVTLLSLGFIGLLFDSASGGMGEKLPESWIQFMGGSIKTETFKTAYFSTSYKIIGTFGAIAMAILFWFRAARRSKF